MKFAMVDVRAGTLEDIEEVMELERAIEVAPHWPPVAYEGIFTLPPGSPRRCLFVARLAGKDKCGQQGAMAGFAVGMVSRAAADARYGVTAELESVAVAPSARRAGIGRRLCVAVLDWCQDEGAEEVALEVRAGSGGAIALYRALGFVPVGRRPRYYSEPEDDALGMRLSLR